jgi:hypothetical protein
MFEKYLPSLLPPQNSESYSDLSGGHDLNIEEANLQTALVDVRLADVKSKAQMLIALDVVVHGIPLVTEQETLTVQFCARGSRYQPLQLNQVTHEQTRRILNNMCKAIEFKWTGSGENIPVYTTIPRTIFTKTFTYPQAPLVIEEVYPQNRIFYRCSKWGDRVTPEYPVIAFGGYTHPAFDLEKCFPMYATLAAFDFKNTDIDLKSLSWWQAKDIFPGTPGTYNHKSYLLEEPQIKAELNTLAHHIKSGDIKVKISESTLYESYKYEVIHPIKKLVRIYFRLMQQDI